jgi:hypothetical protein
MRFAFAGIMLVLASATVADGPPKRLSAIDLAAETPKWEGQLIQTNAQCFRAAVDEYRCNIGVAGSTLVRIVFSDVEPETMKRTIEDNCDMLEKMVMRPCAVQIVFKYSSYRREDSAGAPTILILAEDNKGTFSRQSR